MAAIHDRIPWWAWLVPAAGLGLAFAGLPALSAFGAAMGGVPFGTLVLAIAVTVIETGLIISLMADGLHPELARDSVFASIMIALNGIIGVALVLGGAILFKQNYDARGASAFLTVVIAIATLTLVLPNYTVAAPGPAFSRQQLVFVAVLALALYAVFLFTMTVRHRADFLHGHDIEPGAGRPPARRAAVAFGLMVLSLAVVVLLAKQLAPALEAGVRWLGAPRSLTGVVVAGLVLLPEGVSALKAAARNNLQVAMNLTLGSVLACIGLTIPVVAGYALWTGSSLQLGLAPAGMVLLMLTFLVSILTLTSGRTTLLQGAVHLMVFGVFLLLSFLP